MRHRNLIVALVIGSAVAAAARYVPLRSARAQNPSPPPAAAPTCAKTWGPKGQCCDPAIAAHLPREAVYRSCGESDATFVGEQGSKETCKYVFRVQGQREEETFVQIYAPAQKTVPSSPSDPLFDWKKIGKVFMTSKAKTPKAQPLLDNATGLWMPGVGYFVSVNASTKVCTKPEAAKLAASLK